MSYDLAVYGRISLNTDELQSVVVQVAGLSAETVGMSTIVTRGSRRTYSFTIDGPHALEPGDVPESAAGAIVAPDALYEIHCEGTLAAEIPFAIRFAKALGKTVEGVAIDLQTDEMWPKTAQRHSTKPVVDERISIVKLQWYFAPRDPAEMASSFLRLAHRYLPEMLPRRFGTYEPMTGLLSRDGDDALVTAVREDSYVFGSGTFPVLSMSFWRDTGLHVAPDTSSVSASVDGTTFADPRWQSLLQRFFVGFAEATNSFVATAEVSRNWIWRGRSLWSSGATENAFSTVLRGGQWGGLSPYPVWWSWYGERYLPLIAEHARELDTVATDSGLLVRLDPLPLDRDALALKLASGPGWVPDDLVVRLEPATEYTAARPIAAAPVIPPAGHSGPDA